MPVCKQSDHFTTQFKGYFTQLDEAKNAHDKNNWKIASGVLVMKYKQSKHFDWLRNTSLSYDWSTNKNTTTKNDCMKDDQFSRCLGNSISPPFLLDLSDSK